MHCCNLIKTNRKKNIPFEDFLRIKQYRFNGVWSDFKAALCNPLAAHHMWLMTIKMLQKALCLNILKLGCFEQNKELIHTSQ